MGPALMILGWLLLIPATVILRVRVSRLVRLGSARNCPACGYDRAGLAAEAPCSECGLPLHLAAAKGDRNTAKRRWTLYLAMFLGLPALYSAALLIFSTSVLSAPLGRALFSSIFASLMLLPAAALAPLYVLAHDNSRRRMSTTGAWCLGVTVTLAAGAGAIWCAWRSLSLPPNSFGYGLAMIFVALPATAGAGFGAFLASIALGILGEWDDGAGEATLNSSSP